MAKHKISLRILIGLPASGKSTFARELSKDKYKRIEVLGEAKAQYRHFNSGDPCDEPLKTERWLKRIEERLYYRPYVLVVDGLFLTTEHVMELIDFTATVAELQNITLDYWPENKEECLRNDYLRREISSALSIKNLHIDVDFKAIRAKYQNVQMVYHTVYHIPDYVLFFREYGLQGLEDERYLYSDTWCKGGEAWGYAGNRWSVDADNPPEGFSKLDDLLYSICPDFKMKDYQYIMGHCVKVEERENADYYSRTTEAQYVCDLESLYSILEEKGYLEQGEVLTKSEREMLQTIQEKTMEEMNELERLCHKLAKQKIINNNN